MLTGRGGVVFDWDCYMAAGGGGRRGKTLFWGHSKGQQGGFPGFPNQRICFCSGS